jgi:4-hydroxybenzoate polyprenyltransferase
LASAARAADRRWSIDMARWNTADHYNVRHRAPTLGPFADLAILGIAVLALTLIWLMPAPLRLPALSLASVTIAGALALVAWWMHAKRRTERVNLWDVAGAFAFIGFAAGMISQPEYVVQLFGLGMTAR